MNRGTITDIDFFSESLQEDIHLLVYLPANYSPLYKYSVLIASDGKDYFQLGRISRVVDEYLEQGDIENLIIVGVPYKSVEDRRQKYLPNGEKHEAYLRFLAHELVPYIDEHYSTYQMGMGRALIGDSQAATVSLLAAIQYPNIFGKVLMQSPLVNENVLEKVQQVQDVHAFSIYHVIGTKEHEVVTMDKSIKDFLTPNRALHELIVNKGFSTFYDEFEGNHSWKFWQPDLKRVIKQNFSI
ncbi:alpha/beta hydrolase-fold protein [Viridibacillus sp. FSL E2-0187]|uniref:alpha/beta hydrolase n=1 Tax=Viridibacillus TaxID=496496 RepID=UPI00187BA92D|nr:alpha/beta hydrolase-fold protein [Viridibacillus sp. JNUCC-6]QOV10589.1 esterase family protein [Viridibacillus sp. JNUCC-6]